jgi:hypothetical protein
MSTAAVLTPHVAHPGLAARRPLAPATVVLRPALVQPPIDYDRYRVDAHRLRVEAIRSTVPVIRAWLEGLCNR